MPAGPQQVGCACREGLHPGACPGASERPQRAHSAWAGRWSLLGRPASFWRWLAPLTAQPQAPPHLQGLCICQTDITDLAADARWPLLLNRPAQTSHSCKMCKCATRLVWQVEHVIGLALEAASPTGRVGVGSLIPAS